MGRDSILNQQQKLILKEFGKEDKLSTVFYFTGGTALSEIYLRHRESVDLDFFTQKDFNPQMILEIISSWAKRYRFTTQPRFVDPVFMYTLVFEDGAKLKVDFARYPYKNLEKPVSYQGIMVDSLFDIAANKLLTVNQRSEVKDFVDLYFLLGKFNFWQLRDGVLQKFNMELEPYLMAADYMKVEDFESMPKMLRSMDLQTLKDFFINQAKELGQGSTK